MKPAGTDALDSVEPDDDQAQACRAFSHIRTTLESEP